MSTSNAIPAEPKKVRKFWVALPNTDASRNHPPSLPTGTTQQPSGAQAGPDPERPG